MARGSASQCERSAETMRSAGILVLLLAAAVAPSAGVSMHDIVKRDAKHKWSYDKRGANGPSQWANSDNSCGRFRQSPIALNSSEADLNPLLSEIELDNYDDPLHGAILKNNGHTVQVSPDPEQDAVRTMTGGGLDDTYVFLQAHFHWGSVSKLGSEHSLDGKFYPMELHFVHMNENYMKDKNKAMKREDGLAVLGVFFEMSGKDNPDLEPIVDKLDEVRKKGSSSELSDDFTLESLLPDELGEYFRYKGSLTTPDCNEIVTWTVFRDTVPVSERQLQQFRTLKEDSDGKKPLVDNYRPVQDIGERIVEVSSASAVASSLLVLLIGLALCI